MRSDGEPRVARPSKRAIEASQVASQWPPTPAPSAKRSRRSQVLYPNPYDSQDLSLYTTSQIPPSQTQQEPQRPVVIRSSPPHEFSSSSWPMPPPDTQPPQEQEQGPPEDEDEVEDPASDGGVSEEVELPQVAPIDPVSVLRYRLEVVTKGKHGSGANAVSCDHTKTWPSVRTAKHDDGYRDMMLWLYETLEGAWQPTRLECVVDYRGCRKDDRHKTDVSVKNHWRDWNDILQALVAFWEDAKIAALKVTVVIHCKMQVVDAPAPKASQTKGRCSATAMQFEGLDEHLDDEAARTDYSTELRTNWVCEDNSCPYYSKWCFTKGVGDPLRNHYPLYTNIVTAWAKDIRNGDATALKPSIETVLMMRTAEHHRSKQKGRPERSEVVTAHTTTS
jgi:hypothetical protein